MHPHFCLKCFTNEASLAKWERTKLRYDQSQWQHWKTKRDFQLELAESLENVLPTTHATLQSASSRLTNEWKSCENLFLRTFDIWPCEKSWLMRRRWRLLPTCWGLRIFLLPFLIVKSDFITRQVDRRIQIVLGILHRSSPRGYVWQHSIKKNQLKSSVMWATPR